MNFVVGMHMVISTLTVSDITNASGDLITVSPHMYKLIGISINALDAM